MLAPSPHTDEFFVADDYGEVISALEQELEEIILTVQAITENDGIPSDQFEQRVKLLVASIKRLKILQGTGYKLLGFCDDEDFVRTHFENENDCNMFIQNLNRSGERPVITPFLVKIGAAADILELHNAGVRLDRVFYSGGKAFCYRVFHRYALPRNAKAAEPIIAAKRQPLCIPDRDLRSVRLKDGVAWIDREILQQLQNLP